jgi:hypothetical protein
VGGLHCSGLRRGRGLCHVLSEAVSEVSVSPGYGNSPHWRDGRELFFLGDNQTIEVVTVSRRGEELLPGAPRALFRAPIFPSPWDLNSWDVGRDGSKFVVNTVRASDSSLMIVTNWRQLIGIH